MYSIQFIENTFTALVRSTMRSKFNIELYAWNRTKEDKSDPEMINLSQDDADAYGHLVNSKVSRTNQQVGCFAGDVNNWDNQCYRTKVDVQKEEVGIGMRVYNPNPYHEEPMYLAMIDFNPGLGTDNRYTRDFWKDIQKHYTGRKIYLFNSGNAHHALLDTIHDQSAHEEWMSMLLQHEEVVDQKWVKFANAHSHGGVIRVTAGKTRPQPKLWKWVNL
jgi:hypothetical protein